MADKPHKVSRALRNFGRAEGLDLKAEAEKQRSLYEALIRRFRSDVAELKSLGLLPKDIDARKATPSAYISRVRNANYEVLRGSAKVKRVSPKVAKKLRKEGFTVTRNKVLVRETETIRKGEVVPKASPEGLSSKYATKILRIRPSKRAKELDPDFIEKRIDAFMAGMGSKDYFSVEIFGHYGRTFNGDQKQELLNYIFSNYGANNPGVTEIRKIYVGSYNEAHEFNRYKEDLREAGKRQRDNARKRRQRAAKKIRKAK